MRRRFHSSSDASRRRIFRNGKANIPIPSWRNSPDPSERISIAWSNLFPTTNIHPAAAAAATGRAAAPSLYPSRTAGGQVLHQVGCAGRRSQMVAILAGFFFYREHAKRIDLEQTIARAKAEQAERERIAKEEAARKRLRARLRMTVAPPSERRKQKPHGSRPSGPRNSRLSRSRNELQKQRPRSSGQRRTALRWSTSRGSPPHPRA